MEFGGSGDGDGDGKENRELCEGKGLVTVMGLKVSSGVRAMVM